ncbi:hypothetical protein ACFPAF_03630 [Hymenobacter endophyticus]|uniref:Outer membrane protein beta-barrel domain-containing protein n=1 Tax=Hymenobacter endophyticus TaxID=3076335 RepID=A0ABU3TDL3_9BACT|nr:hypothetical protein [Hymenobacter endophyticus]MDU0369472.1 hypothetical protein [Hymenobacter endophyticus]
MRELQLSSGRQLRREVLPIDYGARTTINQLSTTSVSAQGPDSVLADVLLEGPASLLAIETSDVKHFFVQREQQPYLELTERRYLLERNGRQQVVDGNNYRAQLQVYFGDCPAVVTALAKTPFTASALSNLVQLYNTTCSTTRQVGSLVAPAKRGPSVKILVGPTLGMRYNSQRLRAAEAAGQEVQTLDGVQADGRLHPQAGIFFDVIFGGRKLALHSGLTYARFGGVTAVASPDGSDQWKGELAWQGAMTSAELGLRFMPSLGSATQLVLGTGFTLPPMQSFRTQLLRYGTTSPRLIDNTYPVPTLSEYPLFGFERTLLPYMEAGIRRNRFTLLLHARRYGKESYYDPLVVSTSSYNYPAYSIRGYSYTTRTVSVALSLGFQLNSNSDRLPQAR